MKPTINIILRRKYELQINIKTARKNRKRGKLKNTNLKSDCEPWKMVKNPEETKKKKNLLRRGRRRRRRYAVGTDRREGERGR